MRVEKTVFISYRRTNAAWALAIYQYLSKNGYDVFFDYRSINSGNFEQIIIDNIKSRAHFLVLLTPSALKRCIEPNDWLRREIETAIDEKRNIVPLFLQGFSFSSPSISKYLTGKLVLLSEYNGVDVPVSYFDEALERLQNRYLNTPLELVLHPADPKAQTAAAAEQQAANRAETVAQKELIAQEWHEKGLALSDSSYEEIFYYTEAIRLNPNLAKAFNNRGAARGAKGDIEGAIEDYNEAIRLNPDESITYLNRGEAYQSKKDFERAIEDYNEAIRLNPDYTDAFILRGSAYEDRGKFERAIEDYNEAIRLQSEHPVALFNRGNAKTKVGDSDGAIADYQKFIKIAGLEYSSENQVEQFIRAVKAELLFLKG